MSKILMILDYTAITCAIICSIAFFIEKNWYAAIWAIIALIWMIKCRLTENNYYLNGK